MNLSSSTRPLLFALGLGALCGGCGGDYELARYVIDARVTAPGADARLMDVVDVPPCDNADLQIETLLVYDGYVEDAVTAIQVVYAGIDLSDGGDNSLHFFLEKGDSVVISAALDRTLDLYEVDARGRVSLLEADKKGGDVEHFYEVLAQPVTETHEVSRKEKITFVEVFDNWPCNL